MISTLFKGVVLLAIIGVLFTVPGISPEAHVLARDCLHFVQAAVGALDSVLSKASA